MTVSSGMSFDAAAIKEPLVEHVLPARVQRDIAATANDLKPII
jgi:hypothetical protein